MVSVDQMISPTPGLIAQMTGFLMKQHYTCATVFVDQVSGARYMHLQQSTNAEETIEGKRAFEQYASARGVQVQAYYTDNGVFKANKWVQACNEKDQNLTFAEAYTHHSIGMAKQQINEVQDMVQAAMMHTSHQWP